MAHLAFTWELGAHSGYAALMAQLARLAIARGHRCSFIMRDLHAVAGLLPPALGPVLQAPLAGSAAGPAVRVQTSYATLLHHCGFGESQALFTRLRAWRDLYTALGVDRVVARHSPTGVIAARSLDLPVLHYGTGFTVPPDVRPWPTFRPDLRLPRRGCSNRTKRASWRHSTPRLRRWVSPPSGRCSRSTPACPEPCWAIRTSITTASVATPSACPI